MEEGASKSKKAWGWKGLKRTKVGEGGESRGQGWGEQRLLGGGECGWKAAEASPAEGRAILAGEQHVQRTIHLPGPEEQGPLTLPAAESGVGAGRGAAQVFPS